MHVPQRSLQIIDGVRNRCESSSRLYPGGGLTYASRRSWTIADQMACTCTSVSASVSTFFGLTL